MHEAAPLLPAASALSLRMRLLYALGGLGVYGGHVLFGFFFQTYLLEVARLAPALTGVVLLLGQLSDIVSTPLVGKFSDNCHTACGRRRPWMLAAALPCGVAYFLVWNNWDMRDQWLMFAYFSAVLVVLNAASNCINVPFNALTPDLARSYDDATALTQVRVMCEIAFGVLVAFAQSALIELFRAPGASEPDYALGYEVAALAFAAIFTALPIVSALFLREKARTAAQIAADTRVGLLANVRDLSDVFRSRNFVLLMLMYFLCWTSVVMIQNNLFLLAKYSLEREEHFMYLVALVQLSAAVAAFGWSKLTLRLGKRNTYLVGSAQWVVVLTLFFFLDRTSPLWAIYTLTIYAGACLGTGMLLPWSMLPDVVDEDECTTGVRREGAFYAIFVLLQKVGLATALAASSWVLAACGYVAPPPLATEPDTQPASAVFALRLICGPVAAVLVLLSLIPMLFYSLSRAQLKALHAKLRVDDDSLEADLSEEAGDDLVPLQPERTRE